MIKEELGVLPEYELLDSGWWEDQGAGYRLEKFGDFVLARPDPAVLWKRTKADSEWAKADAVFEKSGEEKGKWKIKKGVEVPQRWLMHYALPKTKQEVSFYAELTPFKHTGIFPEQAANWNFIEEQAAKRAPTGEQNVLNLFGYTGIASVVASKLGYKVTHVDASKPSISWAKENMIATGLPEDSIRWILDDALKFVKREVKRGVKYEGIIMDPPAFGRGAKGEVWKFNEDLPKLLSECIKIVSDDFQFLIINAYAVSVSSLLLKNLLTDFAREIKHPAASIEYGELVLKGQGLSDNASADSRQLSTGIFGRLSVNSKD